MRTTIRIDSHLLERLRDEAHRERIPLTQLVNRVIHRGLDASPVTAPSVEEIFRPRPMGRPLPGIDLSKSNALADALQDEALFGQFLPPEKR
jgi:hypothetical protein